MARCDASNYSRPIDVSGDARLSFSVRERRYQAFGELLQAFRRRERELERLELSLLCCVGHILFRVPIMMFARHVRSFRSHREETNPTN